MLLPPENRMFSSDREPQIGAGAWGVPQLVLGRSKSSQLALPPLLPSKGDEQADE